MASSLIRGKYIICRAGTDASETTIISDGAVFQWDGVIVDVGPYEKLKDTVQADEDAAQPTFFRDGQGQERIGALEIGKRADMVLLELSSIEEPYLDPDLNMVDALLYRGKARQVDTVIIDGQVVLKGGRSTKVDKDELMRELKERFSQPLEPAVLERRIMAQRLLPYVEKFYEGWNPGDSPHYVYNGR